VWKGRRARRHLEVEVVGGTDGTQAEQLERGHDAPEGERACRDRVIEQGVELVVVAVHRRGSLQRLEPHTALLAHKVHAGAHADLVRRQLRESQALAAVPAGALLLDPIDEPRPLNEHRLSERPLPVAAAGELTITPLLRELDEQREGDAGQPAVRTLHGRAIRRRHLWSLRQRLHPCARSPSHRLDPCSCFLVHSRVRGRHVSRQTLIPCNIHAL
jgi:hypothetical protein